jgi:hypothetical protein
LKIVHRVFALRRVIDRLFWSGYDSSMKFKLLLAMLFLAVMPVWADEAPGLKNTMVLVIRHAEKPETGDYLTPVGEARAKAYVGYFKNYTVDSKPITIDYLVATADSKGSKRPRLTVTPFSKATGLAIDQRFASKDFQGLADDLRAKPHGAHILICWHHGQIPDLLEALGANPQKLFSKGKWPDDTFSWVIQLRYDDKGQLVEAKRISENLMPGDGAMVDDPVKY